MTVLLTKTYRLKSYRSQLSWLHVEGVRLVHTLATLIPQRIRPGSSLATGRESGYTRLIVVATSSASRAQPVLLIASILVTSGTIWTLVRNLPLQPHCHPWKQVSYPFPINRLVRRVTSHAPGTQTLGRIGSSSVTVLDTGNCRLTALRT